MFLFVESGRCSGSQDDGYVFARSGRRLGYQEHRDTVLAANCKWRPKSSEGEQSVKCTSHGKWKDLDAAKLVPVQSKEVA